jgi:arsenate reductase
MVGPLPGVAAGGEQVRGKPDADDRTPGVWHPFGTVRAMSAVTIYHNPNCNSSVNAVAIANELGVDTEVVNYRSNPPDASTLRAIIAKLEDPVTDLVRRDSLWQKLGLTDADVETEDQVVDVIVANKMIMQRPLLVTADKAIIGRPKDRVRALLS